MNLLLPFVLFILSRGIPETVRLVFRQPRRAGRMEHAGGPEGRRDVARRGPRCPREPAASGAAGDVVQPGDLRLLPLRARANVRRRDTERGVETRVEGSQRRVRGTVGFDLLRFLGGEPIVDYACVSSLIPDAVFVNRVRGEPAVRLPVFDCFFFVSLFSKWEIVGMFCPGNSERSEVFVEN